MLFRVSLEYTRIYFNIKKYVDHQAYPNSASFPSLYKCMLCMKLLYPSKKKIVYVIAKIKKYS